MKIKLEEVERYERPMTMRLAFRRALGVSPKTYRSRFYSTV